MPRFHPRLYIGPPDNGNYFTSVLPAEADGRLQSLVIREGQEEVRPFLRTRPDPLSAYYRLPTLARPFQPGQLCIVQVETDSGTEDWYRGILTQPNYDTSLSGRSDVTIPALGTIDLLARKQSVSSMSNIAHGDALDTLLDGAGWPADGLFRSIDSGFSDQLDTWETTNEATLQSIEAILATAGPPARLIAQRNGGLLAVRNIASAAGNADFIDADIHENIDFIFDDRSLINQVTIGDETFDATGSPSDDVRQLPSALRVLPGLPASGRAALAERIFDAYEQGLTFVRFDLTLNNPNVYDRARGLQIGTIVGVSAFGEQRGGYVSSLTWSWDQTIARVRVGVVRQGQYHWTFGNTSVLVFGFPIGDPHQRPDQCAGPTFAANRPSP